MTNCGGITSTSLDLLNTSFSDSCHFRFVAANNVVIFIENVQPEKRIDLNRLIVDSSQIGEILTFIEVPVKDDCGIGGISLS